MIIELLLALVIGAEAGVLNIPGCDPKPTCDYPPDNWCDTPNIIDVCGTKQLCDQFNATRDQKGKVKLIVLFEALCPDSQRLILNGLTIAVQLVGQIFDLQMVPYGKAEETQAQNGTWTFQVSVNARIHFVRFLISVHKDR